MNIAMIHSTPCPPEGGIGTYVSNLSRELLDRGHDIHVITRGGLKREMTVHDGIQVTRLPCPPLYPFHVDIHGFFLRRFLSRIEDQLDVIHIHTPLTPPIETSTPLLSTVHSVVEDVDNVRSWSLRNMLIKLMVTVSSKRHVANQTDAADRITTVSSRVSNELADYYGVDGATVVGNGVDTNMFKPGDKREGDFVLFVGRLDYPKGLFDLVEAAEQVVKKHDVDFVITGKGPLRDKIERQAERRGIGDRVRFTGYLGRERQIIEMYQNAAAFVLPSHYEGLPTVLLEAMACGSPVVSTTVGGCPEVIDDGVNGLLVQPRAPSALADALDTVLSDPKLRSRLGSNARKTVLDRYTWDAVADRFEREYRLAGAE